MEIIKTKIIKPPRLLIYGVGGIGKTTFLSKLPNVIFSDIEGGADEIGIDRFPKIEKLADLQKQIEWLCKEDHQYNSYVIDSADWLEKLIAEHVAKAHSDSDLEYGKRYLFARQELAKILGGLDWLREYKKMIIGFSAHAKIKTYNDPLAASYDIYTLNCLDEKFASILIEWCDLVGFANYRLVVETESKSFGKAVNKAKGSDQRVLHVSNKAGITAKNRYGISGTMPLDTVKVLKAIKGDSAKDSENKKEK